MEITSKFYLSLLKNFVSVYGAFETTFEVGDTDQEGVVTKMGKKIGTPKEKPKVSPLLLSAILGEVIFLRLDEIKMEEGEGLPNYDEIIELVDMEEELKEPYIAHLNKLTKKIRDKQKQFLGNLANDAIAIPDMPFQVHAAQNEVFYEPPFTREEFGLTNKEKRLIEIVKGEMDNNRKCLVFVHFSNKGVGKDIEEILSKEFPNKKVSFLSPTIAAVKREQWIKNNPSDILICNPELVKTGLDLLEFPTIIFYETTYNVCATC